MNERTITSKKSVLILIETESVYVVFTRTFLHLCLPGGSVTSYRGWFMGVLPHSIFNLFFLYFHTTTLRNAVVKIIAYTGDYEVYAVILTTASPTLVESKSRKNKLKVEWGKSPMNHPPYEGTEPPCKQSWKNVLIRTT